MARMPFRLTWEWTKVVPVDNAMAPFINGKVTTAGKHEPLNLKRGALYRRRVLILRGPWRLAELRGWDEETGAWVIPASASRDPDG
jgi:hypothetical protein